MGGFHLDSFKGCFVGTIGTEIVLILLIKYRVVPLIISEILSAIAALWVIKNDVPAEIFVILWDENRRKTLS